MDLVPDRLSLARILTGREHEEVRVAAHGAHVEDEDVLRQLLLGEAGDSAGVFEWRQGLFRSSLARDQCSRGTGRARRRRPRRLAGRAPRSASRWRSARGSRTTTPAASPAGRRAPVRRTARGPGADSRIASPTAKRTQRSTSSGSFHVGKAAPSSAPTMKIASPIAAAPHGVDREGVLVQQHLVGELEGRAGKLQARFGRRDDAAVPGRGRHQYDQPVDRQLAQAQRGRARRGRSAAGRRCRRGPRIVGHPGDSQHHARPSSHLVALPRPRPTSRRACSSSSSEPGLPWTRKPRSVRRMRKRERWSGFGR